MKAIICIDDERLITMMLRYQLNKILPEEDYSVEMINNPMQTVDLVQNIIASEIEICLVITDYKMPSLNGPEVIALIKALSPKTRIIMLSGQVGSSIAHKNFSIDKFISKPWTEKELSDSIKTLIA